LDEHLSPEVAKLCPSGAVVALRDWRDGRMLGESDERLLCAAMKDGLVLVTFDVATIPTLLQRMAIAGEKHGGVIFISSRSYSQNDLRGIASALTKLHASTGSDDWRNRVIFLRKPVK
jgi:hypothetical protein